MPKKVGPYVGVTGFMTRDEVLEVARVVPSSSHRRLMVGVLMSSKTLAGQKNKWPGRYPEKEKVAEIFTNTDRVLNLVHYNTDNPDQLSDELKSIVQLAGPNLDGFQLNVTWPEVSEIKDFREAYPEMFVLLQIGSKAMNEVGSPDHFRQLLAPYVPVIDAILIDPSGGKGMPLDPEYGIRYLQAATEYPDLGLGIAGGLGPRSLYLLDSLVRKFPNLSIDAEGQLRSRHPEDALCVYEALVYVEEALQILSGRELPGIRMITRGQAYGFETHIQKYGSGDNMLRTPRLAQPSALKVGDRLATGDEVLSLPREGGNGSVLLHLTGGWNGHWVGVPSRIPIALLTEEDNAPPELWNMK